MKILLVSANTLTEPYAVYPIGLDYVKSSIDKRHLVEIIDMNLIESMEVLENVAGYFKPDVIGLSLRNIDNTDCSNSKSFLNHYKNIVASLRKITGAKIVLGGAGFTIFPDEVLNKLGADFGLIGEGERFNLLIDAIENNTSYDEIPGLLMPGERSYVPEPYGHNFSRNVGQECSHKDYYLKNGGMMNLQTKRGCSFKCIYCTYPHIEGSQLRLIPPADIAKTAKELERAGAKYLFITDSAFNCHYEHSMEVAKAFIKEGVSIPWGAFFAPTKPPTDYFRILSEAGLKHVEFGTESLSNVVLKSYKKPFNVDDVLFAHEIAIKENLHIAHYQLLGGPLETETTVEETLNNAEKIGKTVMFFFCGIRIYPGTELYEIALRERLITGEQSLLEPVFYHSKDITPDKIIKMVSSRSENKTNWIVGSGGEETNQVVKRMYERGYTGPLWEYLIR